MDNYTVEVWEIERRDKQQDNPDFRFKNVFARSPELALRRILLDNKITEKVDAEVIWTENERECRQIFKGYLLEI